MAAKSLKEPIELRKVIVPEDDLYDFISNVKDHLGTNRNSDILTFILYKSSKIPFDEFIRISNHK